MTQMKDAQFSVEFFPPKGPKGAARLDATRAELAALGPDFFSVTFGAGGTTRSGTTETVRRIQRDGAIAAVPHMSSIDGTRTSIGDMLDAYTATGINRIVALRGDLPDGHSASRDFAYANELVAFIKARHGDDLHIEVGAYPEYHPQADSPAADVARFADKVAAGADSAITQYFYNADAYFNFMQEVTAKGVDIPVVPGIMPISNFAQVSRFSALCGADIPRWIRQKMESFGDDADSVADFGRELVARLCQQLLAGGAPGLHFYSLNRTEPVRWLWQELGLPVPPARGVAHR